MSQHSRIWSLIGTACIVGTVLVMTGCSSAGNQTAALSLGEQSRPTPRAAQPEGYDQPGYGFPHLVAGKDPVDLTEPGSFGVGTAPVEIIDTRKFPQQIDIPAFDGPPRRVTHLLPPHSRDKTPIIGEPNDLPLGGVLDEVRTSPGELWPGISQTPWTPPDPTLAVGPTHIVETVNMAVAFYDKEGNLEFYANLDSTGNPGFFETVGAGNFTFDPKCFYDHYSERFVIVALEVYGSTESWIDIAVSDDSNPHGVWYKYRTDSRINVNGTLYWVDYPGFGYDQTGYYVTGNLFRLSGGGGGFAGALFRSFNKTPLLTGQPAQYTDVRDGSAASVQVAQHFGNNIRPFFASVNSTSSIKIQAINNPHSTPTLSTTNVSVPPFSYPSGGAPNLGGGSIDVLDGRIIDVMWRDGRLYAGHGIRASSKNQARWYQFNTNNWPQSGSVTYVQGGNVDGGSGVHTWFPALYENKDGHVGMVMAASSSSTYAAVRITSRAPSDPPGTMGATQQVAIGNSGTSGRWGDYFDIAVDPTNDRTFWIVGQYATPSGWQTWISSFNVSFCDADWNKDGTVNSQDVLAFLNDWTSNTPEADLNGDTIFNSLDVLAFLNLYNTPCN